MEVRSLGAGQLIVEVIAVGTELLLGQIVNTNASWIGGRLAEEGLDAHFQVTVGDNLARLVAAIDLALARSDSVIITGGIGPTQDDLTREAVCQVVGRPMTRDDEHAAWIERRLITQGRAVADNVLRMADLPQGAVGLSNDNGVALGVGIEHDGKWIFAVPGVPREMKAMIEGEVLPRLRDRSVAGGVVRSRVLRTWGLGESEVARRLDGLYASSNPSIAFLIKDMEVQVRVTAKSASAQEADHLIGPFEEEIRELLGGAVFGVDDQTVEMIIIDLLAARDWTVGTLEGPTLGQVGARIAATTGSGGSFAGTTVPGRRSSTIAPPDADVVLTVGPMAGEPGGSEATTPIDMEVKTPLSTVTRVFDFGGDDERSRSFATIAGLHMIRIALQQEGAPRR